MSMLKRAVFVITTQFLNSQANLYVLKFASSITIIGVFSGLEAYYQPYSTSETNLLNTTWNVVSVLVLLCQGLLFENNTDDDAQIIIFFAVIIIIIVCSCVVMTVASVIASTMFPQKRKKVLITRKAARRLNSDTLLELHFVNTLTRIEDNRELEIKLTKWKSLLSRTELEDLRNVLSSVYKPKSSIVVVGEAEHKAANMLEQVLAPRPGGKLTQENYHAQGQMFQQYLEYNVSLGANL
eukprot:TRINITY_DN6648_c0_g1_i1.p1 TRINITY_DN6648_c0_g1~~TRINITY_DN6648_c0_g1_i1.p1  ORF type:complete len:239 (-),score=63.25 TRINITY_DN6648_c0_g1_i1:62-778(-)